jgi:hypothetical protein
MRMQLVGILAIPAYKWMNSPSWLRRITVMIRSTRQDFTLVCHVFFLWEFATIFFLLIKIQFICHNFTLLKYTIRWGFFFSVCSRSHTTITTICRMFSSSPKRNPVLLSCHLPACPPTKPSSSLQLLIYFPCPWICLFVSAIHFT